MTTSPAHQPPKNRRYLIFASLLVIIALPAAAQVGAFLAIFVLEQMLSGGALWMLICGLLPAGLSYLFGRKATLPATFSARYLPFILPIIFLLTVWAAAMQIGHGDFSHHGFQSTVLLTLIPFFFMNFILAFSGEWWLALLTPLGAYVMSLLAFSLAAQRRQPVSRGKSAILPGVIMTLLALICGWQAYQRSIIMLPSTVGQNPLLSEEIDLYHYTPFNGDNHFNKNLTPLRGKPLLQIQSDYPRLDGATAFYPVYAAAVQGLYSYPHQPNDDEAPIADIVQCTTTPEAYQRLIDDETDLIFAAAPSDQQIKAAQEKGLTLSMTPVAKEAFVFLVNRNNPVSGLSVEQIQRIYSGKISNWRDLGGNDAKIYAFQRPEGSGSQSTMLKKVMQGKALQNPLREEYARGMGGLVNAVALYRNDAAAIGYSFRYYTTEMQRNNQVKLLAINGIAPNKANIDNDSYPFTVKVYMVTARPVSDNTHKLMNWFLSKQGQQLIEDVGYVPLHKTSH